MFRLTTILIGCLAFTLAKPPPKENGHPHGPGGPPHKGGPHHGGPPHHDGHPHDDGPKIQFAYDRLAKVAGVVYMLTHECNKEFGKAHEFWMGESPTAKAIEDHLHLIEFLTENEMNECLPSDGNYTVKDYLKRNAETVNTCLAGWKLDTKLQEEAKAVFDKLQELDDQAKTKLENCKPDEECYKDFLESDVKKSIDEQIKEIRESTLVDLRLRADSTSFAAVGDVAVCVMDGTNDLRFELYNSNAAMTVCASQYGLPPHH